MKPPYIYTPFAGNQTIALFKDGAPVLLNTLNDVQVLFLVNGVVMLQFKKTAATGWLTWTAGTDGKSVVCPLTVAQTAGWSGLISTQVVLVDTNNIPGSATNNNLYLAKLSAFTPVPAPTVNPITVSLAFSCGNTPGTTSLLTMTANVSAPNGNYIIQLSVKGDWKRLYKGYVTITNGVDGAPGTGSYTVNVVKHQQVAAGNYVVRAMNDNTGDTSDSENVFIADCWQGEERQDYESYFNGLFAVWGWY